MKRDGNEGEPAVGVPPRPPASGGGSVYLKLEKVPSRKEDPEQKGRSRQPHAHGEAALLNAEPGRQQTGHAENLISQEIRGQRC